MCNVNAVYLLCYVLLLSCSVLFTREVIRSDGVYIKWQMTKCSLCILHATVASELYYPTDIVTSMSFVSLSNR